MVLRNLSQGDGDVAAQARLRGQQVIEAGVTPALGDVEPDGELIPRAVEQEGKVHRGQFVALLGQGFQGEQTLAGLAAGFPQAGREGREPLMFFVPGLVRFRRESLQDRLDQRTERLLKLRDLPQGWCLVERGELLLITWGGQSQPLGGGSKAATGR